MNEQRACEGGREGGREGLPSTAVHLALAVVPRGGQRNDSINKRVSGSRHTSCTSIPSSCLWLQKRFIVLHQGTWGATAVPFLAPGEMKRSPKMLPRSHAGPHESQARARRSHSAAAPTLRGATLGSLAPALCSSVVANVIL